MDGKHLVVSCSLTTNDQKISTIALIDCGATGYSFVDRKFARHHNLPTHPLDHPRQLEVIDGRPIATGDVTHLATAMLNIQGHNETLPMFVTKLGHYPLVLGIPWLKDHDPMIEFRTNRVTFDSDHCLRHCCPSPVVATGIDPDSLAPSEPNKPRLNALQCSMISATALTRTAKREKLQVYSLSLFEVNQAIAIKKGLKPPIEGLVPPEYHKYLSLFSEKEASLLPPHRPYDHKIPLKPDFDPPFGPLYSLNLTELEELKKWLEENLSKGFIRASSSSAGAPILFVKKADGSLRLCVDYRKLNEGTIKNRYPLPLLKETLNRLQKAKVYTKLDVRGAYNLLRVAEGEEWKTAFRTRYGLFESLVMPFGLTNAPASFQHFINDVLRPYLDVFCTAYLDDILIYSDNLEQHRLHVTQILGALTKAGLYLKPEKCEFHRDQVKYLGFIVSIQGTRMDPARIAAINEWQTPRNVTDIRTFLGFCNFDRRYIKAYSAIIAPLTRLTKKDVKFEWSEECQKAFDGLKQAFTTAPVLIHFDPEKECVVETDASDYVSAGILSQHGDDGNLHPVAFYSKKFSPAECNYEIYDKELLAIINAFKEWRSELEGSRHTIKVLTDHRNLEYFMTNKLLNRRQARWSEFLSRFDFNIVYRPGKAGAKPDALTRRPGDLPEEGDERILERFKAVLKPQNLPKELQISANTATATAPEPLQTLFDQAYDQDPFPNRVLEMLRTGVQQSKEISLADCRKVNGRLTYRHSTFVPDHSPLRLRLIRDHHDPPAIGHPGRAKTYELLARHYYWPTMRKDTERYVANCHTCRRTKATRHAPHGVLRPLPVPHQPWQDISIDFVTGLPTSNGFDSICVIVDRLTKQRHLVPCLSTINAEELASLFLSNVFRLHGLPKTIVSDRGPQFAARFWKHLCHCMEIDPRLSTAFHPETDGQTERMNAIMEQYLRAYVNYQQDDWAQYLPLAEFAANNHVSETTTVSPFFANYGFDPRCSFELDIRQDNPEEIEAQQTAEALADIHDVVRSEMRFAQARHQANADRNRVPAPAFQPGDRVWLNARNIRTQRPSRKLDNKRLGPFTVSRVIGSHAYELKLPNTMKVHPVFHVSLLDPAREDPLPGQVQPPPPPVVVDNEEEYQVEAVLDSRLRRGRLQYLVQWVGYDDPTWEPAEYLHDNAALDNFHRQYPDKPGPLGVDGTPP